ncbi:MAG: tripartite tricarboxylate transporter TctB family protein [Xanthobacteraceae bacterium]|nr:tripartite tricarboxylate transporter TctB family protein [Xanthobacteraceae bacterium]
MAAHRIQGLLFVLLGAVSLFDSWRITETIRPTTNFDGIGPDRYLAILSALMIVLGLSLALRPMTSAGAGDWSDLRRWPLPDFLIVAIVLALFVFAIPIIGFSFSCLLFFSVLYRFLGKMSWPRTVIYAVLTTVAIYVIFIYFADMSLPKSFLGV